MGRIWLRMDMDLAVRELRKKETPVMAGVLALITSITLCGLNSEVEEADFSTPPFAKSANGSGRNDDFFESARRLFCEVGGLHVEDGVGG
jgi:hypothetical protein